MSKPFPTFELTYTPNALAGWSEGRIIDNAIRSEFSNGDISSRPRFSKPAQKTKDFVYSGLTYAEKEIIVAWEDDFGACEFEWRNPVTNQDWDMRLASPIVFGLETGSNNIYNARLSMFGVEGQKMREQIIRIENLAAGADIADRPIFVNPKAVTIESIGILTEGAPAGIDDGNTAVILIEDDASNALVTKTYNTANQPPSSDYADLGNLANASLNAGEHLLLSVTQGATADLPAFSLIIEYYYT